MNDERMMKSIINGLFLEKILIFTKKSSCQEGTSVRFFFGLEIFFFFFELLNGFWLLDRCYWVINYF